MKTIDFQGISNLDQPLVEQLELYLQEKEAQLSRSIIQAIHPLPRESLPPVLPYSTHGEIKLSDAVEAFSKNVITVAASERPIVAPNDWQLAKRQINNALWEYVEVLEGCVTELFQQLGQVGFERWNPNLMDVVEKIKGMLAMRMDDVKWKIRRLETLLWDYRMACEAKDRKYFYLKRVVYFWKTLLDRSLHSYLKKSLKFLKIRYKWFSKRYHEYLKLKAKIEQALRKFTGYHVFKSLERGHQEGFKKIYQLLKLWEINLKSKALPQREPIRALRSAYSIDKAAGMFKAYYDALMNGLFERSRKFKRDPNQLYSDEASRRVIREVIRCYRAEVHTLGVTVSKYREFFLRTHPNPYIRTRWGFAEWIVGPEPSQTKEMLKIVYDIELLDKLFEELEAAAIKGPEAYSSQVLAKQYQGVTNTLHELGQPLMARGVQRSRAEKLLHQLQEMEELGSFNPEVVEYVGKALSKALRSDWQYHVFFEIPLFHQIYTNHQGLLGSSEDRSHLGRLNKFKEIISQLSGWVKSRDTHRHVHEIETDMVDLRGYLQDFYASVQRFVSADDLGVEKVRAVHEEFTKQLLQYRYLFGSFFHLLHEYEPEGRLIRNQFLFVDQYFESIEGKLQEIEEND